MKKILLSLFVGFLANTINAQVSVTATAGTATGTYTTLKGAFDAVNLGTHQGAVTINITANTTETATAVLNASGGTSSYTSLTVKPGTGATPTISGSLASSTLVRILGSNITLDGSNTTAGTTRDLTFTNTSTTAPQVINFIATTAAAANTNIVVKNLNIINGISSSSAFIMYDGNTTPTGGYFNNVTIQNNAIKKSYIAMYLFAATAAGNGANTLVTGNDLTSTGADANRLVGVYLQGIDGGTVTNNTIGNFENSSAEIKRGIWFATGTINSSITSNTITNLGYTGTGAGGATGISVTSGNTGASAVANITIRSNNINNFTSSGTGTVFAGIYVAGTATNGVVIDKNKVSTISNTNVNGYGSQGIYVASTNAAANTLVSNNVVNGISAYGYAAGGGVNDNANGIVVGAGGGYKIYYNTVVMDANQTIAGRPSAFNVTTGVTAAGAIDLRNNIFVNSQTQTGDRYTIYSSAANTVFSNINYNDYFSTGAALGFIGSARTALSDIQAGFGGNVNSLNVSPVFVSATDFHISPTGNIALDNKAVPVAEVTLDADGVARNATTPDLGATEFTATLGTQDITKTKINYYPNPVVDKIYLNTEDTISSVDVYNIMGQKVASQTINDINAVVNLSNLSSGNYIIKVLTDKATQNIKIVKN